MTSLEILRNMTLSKLRMEVKKTNLKKYSKLNKMDLINMMLRKEHISNFNHLDGTPTKKKVIIKKPEESLEPKKKVIIRKPKEVKKKVIIKTIPKGLSGLPLMISQDVMKGNSIKTEQEFIKEWKEWDANRQFKFNYTDEQYKSFYKLYLEKENVKPKKKVIIKKPKEVKKKVIIRKPKEVKKKVIIKKPTESLEPKKKIIIRVPKEVKKKVIIKKLKDCIEKVVVKKKVIIRKPKVVKKKVIIRKSM